MSETNKKTNITPPPRKAVIAWVLALFSIILITSSVLAAGRCVPCKLNHYCVDGLRYQCPANTPVTQGMGAGALNECLTCVQRNGNSANPIYDDLVGDCVSCYEYDSSTPIWNGTACVACASGTAFNGETGLCEKTSTCGADYIAINSASDLAKIGNDANYPLDGNYCLQNNISLSAYNTGTGWTPIGDFSGIFDGNNYEISDLYIYNKNASKQALFSKLTSDGIIRNVGLVNVDVYAESVASLVYDNYGSITNTYALGKIKDYESGLGGLVYNNNGTISKSYTNLTMVIDEIGGGGGLVHSNLESGTIDACHTEGAATADTSAGAIAHTNNGTIKNSYSSMEINAGGYGGFVAYLNAGVITNSYMSGYISSGSSGGLAGCTKGGTSDAFFFDTTTTNTSQACDISSADECDGATGLTTSEMQTPQTFIDAGWDTSIWELVQGQYPKLIGVGGQD